jgi:hypothetical protein
LDDKHLREMAGTFSRRLHAFCAKQRIPIIEAGSGERKHELAAPHVPKDPAFCGLFLVIAWNAPARGRYCVAGRKLDHQITLGQKEIFAAYHECAQPFPDHSRESGLALPGITRSQDHEARVKDTCRILYNHSFSCGLQGVRINEYRNRGASRHELMCQLKAFCDQLTNRLGHRPPDTAS